jgi:MFS-type transporter involved in bile tolerance (Atg22 family)
MTTKAAHVFGPLLVGIAALISDAPQVVLLVLLPLFVFGLLLLTRVRVEPR